MRSARLLLVLLVAASVACATTTRLHTEPEGASIRVNGLLVGRTPVSYENGPGLPRRYHIQISKDGYEPLDFYIDTRMSWLWGYLGLVTLVPYLWAWSLKGDYVFFLRPSGEVPSAGPAPSEGGDERL
jgi:hypothetical protein